MPSEQIKKYFEATEHRKIRDDLVFASNMVDEPKVAIDCGCGAGADIEYLVKKGFSVYGFDVEQESITRCQSRFKGNKKVSLRKCSFEEFDYPSASLVVADASLFFCSSIQFEKVWAKIQQCLIPNGIFCGSLLGAEDTMAIPGENLSVFWPNVTAFGEDEVLSLFRQYEVLRFNVHRSKGKTPQGISHSWHIFQVVAKKV